MDYKGGVYYARSLHGRTAGMLVSDNFSRKSVGDVGEESPLRPGLRRVRS